MAKDKGVLQLTTKNKAGKVSDGVVQAIHAEAEDHYPSKGRSNSPSTNGSLQSRDNNAIF